ncbi:MAG: OmpH family outer membrane protein [Bacteroides sp.]|nr:OmpH family outer membrane protein [Bacteroides sp.]
MRKSVLSIVLLFAVSIAANAQKFALIDMEYILENIPAYSRINEQLNQASEQWQREVEVVAQEAQRLYQEYQSQAGSLTDAQRTDREEAIISKEREASELRRQYFGPEGELYKRQENLMRPIQDQIYQAVKEISETNGYTVIVDRASATSIIYASPSIDISDEVLNRLGYSN